MNVCSYIFIYGSSAIADLVCFFSFLIYLQYVGLLGRGSARPKATTYTQNKRTQTYMPRVGLELTISVLERAKMTHAFDCTATVISEVLELDTSNLVQR
jgi:hypothetical protein